MYTALPNFPAPDLPKKKPKYRLVRFSSKAQYDTCFGLKKNMCALLLSDEYTEDQVLQSPAYNLMKMIAKTYRRDPIDFFWMEDNTWQDNIRHTLDVSEPRPQLVIVKVGARPRVAFSAMDSEEMLQRFMNNILEGMMPFKSVSAVPIFEEAKAKSVKERESPRYDEHIEL